MSPRASSRPTSKPTIIMERHVFRTTPLTEATLDEAVAAGKLQVVGSEAGSRFYMVAEIEALITALGYERIDEGRFKRRKSASA